MNLDAGAIDWQPNDLIQYAFWLVVAALIIRAMHSAARALRLSWGPVPDGKPKLSYVEHWRRSFAGRHPYDGASDYWLAFFIGCYELYGYSALIGSEVLSPIAAWIGLKVIAQWDAWRSDRSTFNLFLIGTLLTLTGGALLSLLFR